MPFFEVVPPDMEMFFTLREENKQNNLDFCPHLITVCQSIENESLIYMITTAKQGQLTILALEEGCVLAKTNFQIMFGYTFRITMIKALIYSSNHEDKSNDSKKSLIVVGFEDGTISIYGFVENGIKPFVPVFRHRPNIKKKQPVLDVCIHHDDIIILTSYTLVLWRKFFESQCTYAVNQKLKPGGFLEKQIYIPINSCKLGIEIDLRNHLLYVFNEYEGATVINLSTMQEHKRIQDSIKVMKVCKSIVPLRENIVVTAGTEDVIKFIDYNKNIVNVFTGLKNYPSCLFEDEDNELMWVGDLYGSVTCFSYAPRQTVKQENFVIVEHKVNSNYRVSENGIKKIIVHRNLLIVFDCNHDVFLFDLMIPMSSTEIGSSNMELERE